MCVYVYVLYCTSELQATTRKSTTFLPTHFLPLLQQSLSLLLALLLLLLLLFFVLFLLPLFISPSHKGKSERERAKRIERVDQREREQERERARHDIQRQGLPSSLLSAVALAVFDKNTLSREEERCFIFWYILLKFAVDIRSSLARSFRCFFFFFAYRASRSFFHLQLLLLLWSGHLGTAIATWTRVTAQLPP